MKKFIVITCCLLLAATAYADKTKDVKSIVEWRYVGYTSYQDDGWFEYGGLVGIAAMNKACAEDFGPGARAATISEALFINEPVVDPSEPPYYWLVPGGPMTAELEGADDYRPHDAATGKPVGKDSDWPADALLGAYCQRYTTDASDHIGIVLSRDGSVVSFLCKFYEYPAACSAPVEIPVTQ